MRSRPMACRALISELPGRGFGANAVSGGELALARRAGFPVESIALEGIGKTPADLRRAVGLAAAGTPLRWLAIESADEAAALAASVAAARRTTRAPDDLRLDALIRLNPSVRAGDDARPRGRRAATRSSA